MGRTRVGVLYTPAIGGGAVYVKAARSGSGYRVFWRDTGGTSHESSRATLEEARVRADELAVACALPSGAVPFIRLLEDHLITRRPEEWSDSYVDNQQHLAKWFEPFYGVACGELSSTHIEGVIAEVRKHRRGASTEGQVVELWKRVTNFGRLWGYLAPDQMVAPRERLRKVKKVRHIGDVERVWHRDDLPDWESLFAYAERAAEKSGVWWESLRALWLLTVGERWGEQVGQRGTDLWLAPGSTLKRGQVAVQGKVTEVRYKGFVWEDYTKNGTVRVTSYPAQLHDLLARRYAELADPSDLLFPGPTGGYESRSSYRNRLFLPIGSSVGWPVKTRRANGKVSALLWTVHDFRHVSATTMLTSPTTDPDRWYEGRGMSPYEVALALGDTVETILRTYVGRSEAAVESVRRKSGWD